MNHLFKQFIAHLVTFFVEDNQALLEDDLADHLLDSLIVVSLQGI